MEAAHTPSSGIVDDKDDDDMDAMDHQDTHPASPSDQTLLTQEFASPASASVSSVATRSSNRRRTSPGDPTTEYRSTPDKNDNENGSANGNTASSPQCLTQDLETAIQGQVVDNQDDNQASPSASINNDDNDNNNIAEVIISATSSDDDDSSEDEDDDDENGPNSLSLMDRRKRNVERNQAVLNRLGLVYGIASKRKFPFGKKSAAAMDDNGEEDPEEPTKCRGMLLSTPIAVPKAVGNEAVGYDDNASDNHDLEGLASLQSMFSHRQAPIRKLYSVLATAASQSQSQLQSQSGTHGSRSRPETSRFVPAPIIVTGSSGSGKTAILRATVQAIEKGNRVARDTSRAHDATVQAKVNVKDGGDCDGTQVVSAYINCATMDVSSIDELVTNAHNQFQEAVKKLSGNATVSTKIRSKRRKKRSSYVVTDQGKE
jgi:hypothetical protein